MNRHPGYLYAYAASAPQKEIEALEALLGIESGSLPRALTLNEVRAARSALDVGSSAYGELEDLRCALAEIEEHDGERAPWNGDALISGALTELATALAPHNSDMTGPQIACEIAAAAGYRFGAPAEPPNSVLGTWFLLDIGIAVPRAEQAQVDEGLRQLQQALLADPHRAAAHLMRTLGLQRESSRETWRRLRPIIEGTGARDEYLNLDRFSRDYQVASERGVALLASTLFARNSARHPHGLAISEETIKWIEAPNDHLSGATPADLIRDDPQGNWTAVLTAAQAD
ncbi:hypothetical protein [Miltoncostaea oceani]|uniref:hypothetical protein n=1 Tax=Miltoncostaea oceani TaxID=2843216 RepID=UPI001C3DF54B|nr:hypothetical protein [Miltoncostaea oceani]